MKSFKLIVLLILFGFFSITTFAQKTETKISNESKATTQTKTDKLSYYRQRAIEDAKYEQQFNAENEDEEIAFWDEQKHYEQKLKAKDRKAYRVYMRGKRDAYASHYAHCNAHCHHSDYYYHHATFYYYGYDRYYYERYPQSRSINTTVSLGVPSVNLGLFLF